MRRLLYGNVINGDGVQCLVHLSGLGLPGTGRNLLSVKKTAHNRVVSIFDMGAPRLEANIFTLPLQELTIDLFSFSLNLTNDSGTSELVKQATADAALWNCQLRYLK